MKSKLIFIFSTTLFLVACGGGGSSTTTSEPPPVASKNTFDLKQGYANFIKTGFSKALKISGTCTGTLDIQQDVPIAIQAKPYFEQDADFYNHQLDAVYTKQTLSMTLSQCGVTTADMGQTMYSDFYYDATYSPLGRTDQIYKPDFMTSDLIQYGEAILTSSAAALPNNAHVGDQGAWVTHDIYTYAPDRAKAGSSESSYEVLPLTESTALLKITTKKYHDLPAPSTDKVLDLTETYQYVVNANGELSLRSIDYQYGDSAKTHFLAQ